MNTSRNRRSAHARELGAFVGDRDEVIGPPATPAFSRRRRKCAASEFGSMVVPDLLASRYSVRSGGVAAARTAAGSVESNM